MTQASVLSWGPTGLGRKDHEDQKNEQEHKRRRQQRSEDEVAPEQMMQQRSQQAPNVSSSEASESSSVQRLGRNLLMRGRQDMRRPRRGLFIHSSTSRCSHITQSVLMG